LRNPEVQRGHVEEEKKRRDWGALRGTDVHGGRGPRDPLED